MKKLMLFFVFFALSLGSLFAQKTVSGQVTDEYGLGIPGVNVVEKGTTNGTSTDIDGKFTLSVEENALIQFSSIGMKSKELPIGNVAKVIMKEDISILDEVVVTAMGIKRSEKSLSYATQKVSGEDITNVPSSNVLSNLSGKTAGLIVSGSGSGVGSSVKVVLRGNRSIQGNNQPLYIVDGTPINSSIFTQTGAEGGYGGGIDTGDGMAGINPQDIESINVLKGATAAALYGSQAANGVIVITTKKGVTGKTAVNFTSSIQADIPYMSYKFQDRYTMGVNGSKAQTDDAWGAKRTNEDLSNSFIEDFFKTGMTFQNNISVSGGTEAVQSFLSYQNTTASGIIPNNDFNKHNLSLRGTTSLFDKFIEVDGSVALTKQDIDNAPSVPGQYYNPIVGLYLYPEGTSEFNKYRKDYELPNPARNNLNKMNWKHEGDINKNPYWLVNNHKYMHDMEKIIVKTNVKINFTDWLNLQLRGSYDKTNTNAERKVYSGMTILSGPGGRYDHESTEASQSYIDALLTLNKQFGNFSLSSTVGTSLTETKFYENTQRLGDLVIPNLFDIRNFKNKPELYNRSEHKRLQSVFGTISVGYSDMVFLDITGRNDWSSTLPKENQSYFYPSIGTSFVFTEALNRNDNRPAWLNFGKIRFSWTQVGNDMPWGLTEPYDTINSGGEIVANTVKPFTDLKPEESSSIEGGLNMRMFNNKLTLDMAWYQTITENQYFLVDNPSGTGYSKYYINAGKVRNRGFEVSLGFTPIEKDNFVWNGYMNFSTNKNMILSLPKQYTENGLELSNTEGFRFRLYEGEEWGEMYAKRLKRDKEGNIIITQTNENGQLGEMQLAQGEFERVGNVNPDFMLGLKNDFTYKNWKLGFLIDGRFGGKVLSATQNFLNRAGRSAVTADARDNGGVAIKGVLNTVTKVNGQADTSDSAPFAGKIDAQTYYKSAPIGEASIYDATNVRLRELSLSYTLPNSLVQKMKVISSVKVSLIARNLFFFYKDAPYDPETTLSTSGNGGANIDNFGMPTTRNVGFSLSVNF